MLDVQPKLAARVRLLATGVANKNDPNDARSVAVAALRSAAACLPVRPDDHAAVLKIWAKRHRDLSRARTQVACRLHAVLCELVPGGLSKEICAAQAAAILDQAEPGGAVRQARWSWPRSSPPTCAASTSSCARPGRSWRWRSGLRQQGDRGLRRRPVHRRHRDRRCPRRVPVRQPGPFRRLRRHRTDRGVLRQPEGAPAVAARQPAAEPRHPHGRDHPDPLPAQRRPRLLRAEDRRGQDTKEALRA